MTSDALTTMTFTPELQTGFAKLSGDWNPMHMSVVAARRIATGRLLVHGIHTVLAALESIAASSPGLPAPARLAVKFWKPVYLDELVHFQSEYASDGELHVQIVIDGVAVSEVRINLSDTPLARAQCPAAEKKDENVVCHERTFEEMAALAGAVRLAATPGEIAAHFPRAASWLGANRVGGLLCLSRLVGMECPGLHSLFSGFTIEFSAEGPPSSLEYQVVSTDKRYRLVKIKVEGLGLRGVVEAFARHRPSPQMSIHELSRFVSPNEFKGQRAMVVGGSRGLGEFTAKALAAGGAAPVITYATGKEDAERVAKEIESWGGTCDVIKYDVLMPVAEQRQALGAPVSYLYYYPTCQIFRRRSRLFDAGLLNEFLKFYVSGFYDVCAALMELSQGISAFYPSSVAVSERPRDMTEYAMAKAAGEILCCDLNQSWPGMQITQVRLPRLLTDQTATLIPAKAADPVEVVLPVIRKVQAVRF